ncbi:hypothetical protein B0H10DRAFT_723835 [Mycena sp. CBHHK59/15]|nr:hypothetical protein B0H10DRAFT_723835 [Mycena sp. CBHHK59/15]
MAVMPKTFTPILTHAVVASPVFPAQDRAEAPPSAFSQLPAVLPKCFYLIPYAPSGVFTRRCAPKRILTAYRGHANSFYSVLSTGMRRDAAERILTAKCGQLLLFTSSCTVWRIRLGRQPKNAPRRGRAEFHRLMRTLRLKKKSVRSLSTHDLRLTGIPLITPMHPPLPSSRSLAPERVGALPSGFSPLDAVTALKKTQSVLVILELQNPQSRRTYMDT